ncbi:MAG: hypothetical protein OHK0015_32610 [Chloroflexi bacterium OHK40]
MSHTLPEQQLRWLTTEARPDAIIQRRYQRARTRAALAALYARVLGRHTALPSLAELLAGKTVRGARTGGLRSVPLARIVASEGRSADFDHRFRPRQTHTWDRWRAIAQALWRGEVLPPVELIEVRGSYAVRDGHHRISAASALGQDAIDAVVTILEV